MKLLVSPADGNPFERTLDQDSLVIGRASSADLLLADPFLSRHHARLYRRDGHLFVEDLGSRNGTRVNGREVRAPTAVQPGDRIGLSGSHIDLEYRPANLSTVDLQATVLRPALEFLESSRLETQAPDDGTDADVHTHVRRLQRLNRIYKEIGRTLSIDELRAALLDRTFEELEPEHLALFLEASNGAYEPAGVRSAPHAVPAPPLSRALVQEVCHRGMSALVNDIEHDERFADSKSLVLSGPRSLAAAPLVDEAGTLGMLVASSTATVRKFHEEDLEFLTSVASVAALKIRNLRLARAAIARERHEQELKIARRIQESLLPLQLPHFAGLELFARNSPSRGVSGDFYEVAACRDGRHCSILVVDVSGKGIPAALLTASIEALVAGPMEDRVSPDEVLGMVSRRLYERTPPEKYATAFFAIIDTHDGTVHFSNAGHNPSLLVHADGRITRLEVEGKPLGLVRGSSYELGEVRLAPGDSLVVYTDGLTEAENPSGEQFGTGRLEYCSREGRALPIEQFGTTILDAVARHGGGRAADDDCTLLIARRS